MGLSPFRTFDHVSVKAATDKALLLEIEDEQVWVPKSVIADVADYEFGDEDVMISIHEWWCDKNGLKS